MTVFILIFKLCYIVRVIKPTSYTGLQPLHYTMVDSYPYPNHTSCMPTNSHMLPPTGADAGGAKGVAPQTPQF